MTEAKKDQTLLQVKDLCLYFKLNRAVDNISFDIKKGEVFGLVGESGCGKTTTGRSIIRLYDITSGSIYFKGERIAAGTLLYKEKITAAKAEIAELKKRGGNGEKIKELISTIKDQEREIKAANYDQKNCPRSLITQIQMIFQDPIASLDPRMTVRDIIAEGLIIAGERDRKLINKKVYEVLDTVGLVREHASRYPHEFSGGQRQRIGIARAIIMQPELIIADEPISALDVSVQAQVINLLNDLRKKLGLTILFIAHDLSVVKYFSDRIGVMYFGKIIELAPSRELFANPCHPYTKSLLSAIPLPDPEYEKKRRRIVYDPAAHDYKTDKPSFREVFCDHFVYCNEEEFKNYRKQIY